VPEGVYYVDQTIKLINMILYGEGANKSILVGTMSDEYAPLLAIGRAGMVMDLGLRFADSVDIYADPAEGKRVLIRACAEPASYGMTRGMLRNLSLRHCGTAIYDNGVNVFSSVFNTLDIRDFSYKGIHLFGDDRTGNIYKNIRISNVSEGGGSDYAHIQSCSIPLHFDGEESESSLDQICVKWCRCDQAVKMDGMVGFSVGVMRFERVALNGSGNALLDIDSSSGTIQLLSTVSCDLSDGEVIRLRDATYSWHDKGSSCNYLGINSFHCRDINPSDKGFPGGGIDSLFRFITRDDGYASDYFVKIDNYVWFTSQSDVPYYQAFQVDPHDAITFLNKGF